MNHKSGTSQIDSTENLSHSYVRFTPRDWIVSCIDTLIHIGLFNTSQPPFTPANLESRMAHSSDQSFKAATNAKDRAAITSWRSVISLLSIILSAWSFCKQRLGRQCISRSALGKAIAQSGTYSKECFAEWGPWILPAVLCYFIFPSVTLLAAVSGGYGIHRMQRYSAMGRSAT
ncbi:uncharacterized protein F5Z01DRAFT_665664 [Emericellopsis atlantica]|uniref:Uncharacterized protein n=1 Tax=Emericellopsis atlantica TaxID=2614577 RepID=A0A9P7ZEK1_9HYPO|nr:uncharacterized protein F5Z01DRAFT_665664 [Emericellopsis atlantica]KAG9250673.1 hypothetical protein F5Z01DRAFT_665664 [Emericellopsis atlantica]